MASTIIFIDSSLILLLAVLLLFDLDLYRLFPVVITAGFANLMGHLGLLALRAGCQVCFAQFPVSAAFSAAAAGMSPFR
jgi:hypothetical protein